MDILSETRTGKEFVKVYTYNEIEYVIANLDKETEKSRSRYKKHYLKSFMAFDIETTTIKELKSGFMYHWQFVIGTHFSRFCVIGRTWEEFMQCIHSIVNALNVNDDNRLVIYVHNLSFEFQFVNDFLSKKYGTPDIFATKPRKPIKVYYPAGIEMRCSYFLTNMSLEKACLNEQGCFFQKAKGDLDYNVIRTPKTLLADIELGYCVSDVMSLHDLICAKLVNYNDCLQTIPMTSTSYVRRECRKYVTSPSYRNLISKLTMSKDVYELLSEAKGGGDTHASRFMANSIIEDVDSYDLRSSYPYQMVTRKFPMEKFSKYGDCDLQEIKELLKNGYYAILCRVVIIDLQIKKNKPFPCLSHSKCRFLKHMENKRDNSIYRVDNGRLLSCNFLETTVTDIDLRLILEMYDFKEIFFSDVYVSRYDYLPKALRDYVINIYHQKCEISYKRDLAKKQGNKEEYENLDYLYKRIKERLNGIFGMTYTDPVREEIIFSNGEWSRNQGNAKELLEKANKSKSRFLYFPWGVWVAAWGRFNLNELRKAVKGNQIYGDTDSCKSQQCDKQSIENFNEEVIKVCEKMNAYSDVNGERYYLGIAEHDAHYKAFKTLGAKKYAYIDDDDKLGVTISGVGKIYGAQELESLNNFGIGFTFEKAGGTEAHYNKEEIHVIIVDGCTFTTASNIGILPSTYTLGVTKEYAEILGLSFTDLGM